MNTSHRGIVGVLFVVIIALAAFVYLGGLEKASAPAGVEAVSAP